MRSKFSIEIQKDSYRVEIRMNGNQTRIFVDDNEEDTMKTICNYHYQFSLFHSKLRTIDFNFRSLFSFY